MPIATTGTFYDAQTYRRVASTQRWFWIAVTSPSSGDVFIVALTAFVLSFAILSGAGINLRSRTATQELVSLRKVHLLISLGLAVIAAVWMMRKK